MPYMLVLFVALLVPTEPVFKPFMIHPYKTAADCGIIRDVINNSVTSGGGVAMRAVCEPMLEMPHPLPGGPSGKEDDGSF